MGNNRISMVVTTEEPIDTTIDKALGHVPLSPAKPPMHELNGPVTHAPDAMPIGVLRRD